MNHYSKLLSNYKGDDVVVVNLNEIIKDEEMSDKLRKGLFQKILNDYNYKFNDVTVQLNQDVFPIRVNSLVIHLILWKPFMRFNKPLEEDFFIDTSKITPGVIADYLDKIIAHFITDENQYELNDIISDITDELRWISIDVNPMVGNSINIYDKIQLASRNERYNELIHTKLDEDVLTMEEIEHEMGTRTNELIDILKTEDNCFKDYLCSGEGINRDQLTQMEVIIGPKPTQKGNVFPKIINSNFLVGGLQSASDYYIDSSGGRKASIINFSQVSVSGYMTRKLSLLCMNTVLNVDNHDCGAKHLLEVDITNDKVLGRLHNRYAMLDGKEILIDRNNKDLIGKHVGVRSPITCASKDNKICRKCYGEMYKINNSIHVGILGCQFLTEQQTQKMLSAKHLLKTNAEVINWQPEFLEFFNVSSNSIGMNPSLDNYQNYSLVFDDADFMESGDAEFSRSTMRFSIVDKAGETIKIESEKELYLSDYINDLIDNYGIKDDSGEITLPMREINKLGEDETIFFIAIENNELSKHLHAILNLIEQKDHLGTTTISELMAKFYELVNEAGISVDSVHLENIVREIIRDPKNVTKRPDWSAEEEVDYKIERVSDAILNSDSVAVSLSFERIKQQLYEPLTYDKDNDSFLDLLFK